MHGAVKRVGAAVLAGLLILATAGTPAVAKDSQKGRWLKIRVYEHSSSTPTVLVNLPMRFVSVAMKVLAGCGTAHATIDGPSDGGKPDIQVRTLDLDEIMKELESMEPGQIVEIQDDDDRVSIWIE